MKEKLYQNNILEEHFNVNLNERINNKMRAAYLFLINDVWIENSKTLKKYQDALHILGQLTLFFPFKNRRVLN